MKCGVWSAECGVKKNKTVLHSAFRIPHSALGFTLLELALALCVIVALYAAVLHYAIRLFASNEHITVEQTVVALQNGLEIQVMQHLLEGNMTNLPSLEDENPMRYLFHHPETYLGELAAVDPKKVKEGSWYFDITQRVLVYKVIYPQYFESEVKSPALIRWRVQFVYEDNNENGQFDERVDQLTGLLLIPKEPYRWLNKPSFLAEFKK